jgi:HEAT repeat protein
MRDVAAGLACISLALSAFAQTQSDPAADHAKRLADFVSLIEGPNTPQARRTGARELLRQGWPEIPERINAVLAGSNRPGRLAIALALSESPEHIQECYIEPLIAMLRDEDADSRAAAAAALAAAGSDAVIARLNQLLGQAEAPLPAKLAAIESLGNMTRRSAVAALIGLTADITSPLCRPAMEALERATAQDFGDDPARASAWWREMVDKPLSEWNEIQIDRLVRQADASGKRIREMETRLTAVLRDAYLRAAEADRAGILATYLADSAEVVRLLGLEIVQAQLGEGRTLGPDVTARCRGLVTSAEPAVRAAAIRAVASFREKGDAERFRHLLTTEQSSPVRIALVYALGCAGGPDAVAVLIPLSAGSDAALADEAVHSIGRLGERGVLDNGTRESAAQALLARAAAVSTSVNSRERLFRAMARIGDRRFAPILLEAISGRNAATVRVAAIRGVAALLPNVAGEPAPATGPAPSTTSAPAITRRSVGDAIASCADDADVVVRRAAIETLGAVADCDAHLQILWSRICAPPEPDEAVRSAAWKGVLSYLTGRSPADVRSWLARLPEGEAGRTQRHVDLAVLLEKALASDAANRADLGRTRARIAATRSALNQPAEALAAYLAAIDDLAATGATEVSVVAVELLRFALLNDRYDAQVAGALKPERVRLDGAALWNAVHVEVESRVNPDSVDRAIAMMAAFLATPPSALPDDVRKNVESLLGRARALQTELEQEQVKAGIDALRRAPASEGAQRSIARCGRRAIPALRAALSEALDAAGTDHAFEQALHDLLKAAAPEWPGYTAGAAPAEKIAALAKLKQ